MPQKNQLLCLYRVSPFALELELAKENSLCLLQTWVDNLQEQRVSDLFLPPALCLLTNADPMLVYLQPFQVTEIHLMPFIIPPIYSIC